MPVPHHSVFTGRMPFLPPNEQRQSTEGIIKTLHRNDTVIVAGEMVVVVLQSVCRVRLLHWAAFMYGTLFIAVHQSGTSQWALTICSWEGNRRSVTALAICYRHQWSNHLPAYGLAKGGNDPAYALSSFTFTFMYIHCSGCCYCYYYYYYY